MKYEKPENVVSKRCIDFKTMEKIALEYKKEES